ncbi:MAG TPA: tetratricopeptide repeat protein [Candidatus Acidoferrales bacterium]|nr:tetratricopeptide repeat protein [Candidatus Acidoferrales bacterium]
MSSSRRFPGAARRVVIPRAVFIFLLAVVSACSGAFLSGAESEFERGLALFNQGRHEDAIPHFQRAIDRDPEFAPAHLYLGRSYLSLRRWREAIAPLRTAYRLAPETTKREALDLLIDALLGAALADRRDGHFDSSARYLKEALQLDPQSPRAQQELLGTPGS